MAEAAQEQTLRPGYLRDYISGQIVKATPEEVQATQVFSQRLVEDYGYPKEHIVTRPQHRVRKSPSGGDSYPVDIAVFKGDEHHEHNLYMIVECKRESAKDGLNQLRLYMQMSSAEVGIWFNGGDHRYLRKVYHPGGRIEFVEIPDIPKFGQQITEIGLHLRRDLKKPSNLKVTFHILRNHLAGNAVGVTRDEALASEIINILFCKIYDEVNTAPDEMVSFRAAVDDTPKKVHGRIIHLFKKVRSEYADVFDAKDVISLDPSSIRHVVGELQNYCITAADRDAVGDAFEVFIGPALRGSEGQFFTPRNVVQMVIDMVDPKPGEMVIDPACGSGGFLIGTLSHIWAAMDRRAEKLGWDAVTTALKRKEVASKCLRGMDKDGFLAKVTKAYMAIMGDGRGGVFCENSLERPVVWRQQTQDKVELGLFDVVVTNPPFGKKIKIKGAPLLGQYDLGHKWRKPRKGPPSRKNELERSRPPQLLFVERCLQLLKDGGRLGVVIPESTLGSPSYTHLMHFLLQRTTIRAVVTLPEPLFKTSGKGGTHTKVCALYIEKTKPTGPYNIFMADVKWCGHDSRGNPTLRRNAEGEMILLDEVPAVAVRYQSRHLIDPTKQNRLGFMMSSEDLRNRILVPKYYDPGIRAHLKKLKATHELMTLQDLIKKRWVSVATGVEVGKMAYGTGDIPFVRTSDLSNWEIKNDPKHGVSQEIYDEYMAKAEVQAGDILLVKDGTYLIGTSAIVTKYDLPMLYQSHLYRIRVKRPEKLNPWLLFACLNSPIVKRQIRSVQFTQDIIDSIGRRLHELSIPIPKDPALAGKLAADTQQIVETRNRLKNLAKETALLVESGVEMDEEDLASIADI